MLDDRALVVPIGVELHPPLLREHAGVALTGIKADSREVSVTGSAHVIS